MLALLLYPYQEGDTGGEGKTAGIPPPTPNPAPMNWRARWIWSPGEAAPRNFYWCVRKEFQLSRGFSKVTVALSADTRYTLWFNGRLIGHGPIRS